METETLQAAERPATLTLTGTAHRVSESTVRVRMPGLERGLLLDLTAEGVQLDYLEPPRVWTDGDVVQRKDDDRVWRRRTEATGVVWGLGPLLSPIRDAGVDALLAEGKLRVLRCQADEVA